jgi:hypothetical protein
VEPRLARPAFLRRRFGRGFGCLSPG